MKKVLLVIILLVCILFLSIIIGYLTTSVKYESDRQELTKIKLVENNVEDIIPTSSAENVISPDLNENNEELVDNNTTYVVKELEGCVVVYRVDGDKLVYEDSTDILTKYLSDEDLIELRDGIEVNGLNELTHLIEDFE